MHSGCSIPAVCEIADGRGGLKMMRRRKRRKNNKYIGKMKRRRR
jgi:hypothetical protein